MKKLLLPLAIASLSISSFANAKDGAFVSLYSGMNFGSKLTGDLSKKLKTGATIGLGAGYNYQDWTFSGTLDMRSLKEKDNSSSKIKTNLLLANAAYNFNNVHNVIKPYVGYGFGFAQTKAENNSGTTKLKNALAHQIKAGANFNINENFQAFADLRYTSTFKAKIKDSNSNGKIGVNFYSVNVGVNYLF